MRELRKHAIPKARGFALAPRGASPVPRACLCTASGLASRAALLLLVQRDISLRRSRDAASTRKSVGSHAWNTLGSAPRLRQQRRLGCCRYASGGPSRGGPSVPGLLEAWG